MIDVKNLSLVDDENILKVTHWQYLPEFPLHPNPYRNDDNDGTLHVGFGFD